VIVIALVIEHSPSAPERAPNRAGSASTHAEATPFLALALADKLAKGLLPEDPWTKKRSAPRSSNSPRSWTSEKRRRGCFASRSRRFCRRPKVWRCGRSARRAKASWWSLPCHRRPGASIARPTRAATRFVGC